MLSSYTRCLTHDMLAVWRRVSLPPANSQQTSLDPLVPAPPTPVSALPPALSLKASKELWIFWYGEEPDLTGLISPQLLLSGNNIRFINIFMVIINIIKIINLQMVIMVHGKAGYLMNVVHFYLRHFII